MATPPCLPRLCYHAPDPLDQGAVLTRADGQIQKLEAALTAHGQGHVLDFWPGLDPRTRSQVLDQLERICTQLADWKAGVDRALKGLTDPHRPELKPIPVVALPEHGGDPAQRRAATKAGLKVLGEGRVAVFVVAGGQGTRLGFSGPKGAFPVGPVTDRSLFALQAQKIRRLARAQGYSVPWYVMTSPATDSETRTLFQENQFFGLDPSDVMIFPQLQIPACDFEGRLILEAPGVVSEAPNGHGGALVALADSGALDDMSGRGIDRIFYYQVDNPLIRMADPLFLGLHEMEHAEMSCKVMRRTDPAEKVGVLANIDGQVGIVEYTEIQEPERSLADSEGDLVFWPGNLAIHVFSTDFVRRVAAEASTLLPYHLSAKRIPYVDSTGQTVAPDEPNGYKLERFVFDALPAAARVAVLEVRTTEEFAPIKNAEGKDSPASSRQAVTEQNRRWLEAAGLKLPGDTDAIEIDHAQLDSAEDVQALGARTLEEAASMIRVSKQE